MSESFIPFNRACLFPECYAAIKESEERGKLAGDGYNSKRVVKWFGERFGFDRCLLTPSCTAALEMAALILDIQPGDEVIVPSFTFVSSANAFALRGARLVFVDSEDQTPNLDVEKMKALVTPKTKAFLVVHYAGVPVDLRPLESSGIPIVEDCAHAIGSIYPYNSQPVGSGGVLSCFSFHETKNIPIGEGGLLVVNDPSLWERAQIVREKGTNRTRFTEGRDPWYTWLSLGSSFLMSDIDASILYGVLSHYDELQTKRSLLWDNYSEGILTSSLWSKTLSEHRGNAHIYYLKFYDPKSRQDFIEWMKSQNILVTTHYKSLDLSPFALSHYQSANPDSCPKSQIWSDSLVRLPLFYSLSLDEQAHIIETVNCFAREEGLVLRSCQPSDFEGIRDIRNANRHAFSNSHLLTCEEHAKFMHLHHSTYRLAFYKTTLVGFIGQVDQDLRLGVSPLWKRKGVGRFMVKNFCRLYPKITVKVKRSNSPSLEFFKSLGWIPQEGSSLDPVPLVFKKE